MKVADRLTQPDKLTLAAEKSLNDSLLREGFVQTADDQFPIRVTPANTGRVLRILDALLKAWRARGCRIVIDQRQAFVWTGDVRQRVSLWEVCRTHQKTSDIGPRKLSPTGQLAFRMDWWGARQIVFVPGPAYFEASGAEIFPHGQEE